VRLPGGHLWRAVLNLNLKVDAMVESEKKEKEKGMS
jgi:hypothetical protein